jgi:hypothetical protein
MTTTSLPVNKTKNGLVGSTVTFPGPSTTGINTAPIPPLTVGQVYTTNTTVSAGHFLTSNGNGTSWTTGTTTTPYDAVLSVNQTKPATIEVKGNMVINGRDLEERLDTIEKVLQIPERDVILEKKHPKLKKLYDEYIQALGKYRTFEAIKGEE